MDLFTVTVIINGKQYQRTIEPRLLLSDFLRHEIGLTGTHVGCEHGVCGACTILFDGEPVRSCIMFAVQANGHELMTVEGLTPDASEEHLHPLQASFREAHGLQCGFCTPGMIMASTKLVEGHPHITDEEIRHGLEGNICRCTGYENIVRAVKAGAQAMAGGD